MNLTNILFATDFSPICDGAFALATSLARDTGATLHIVHVEEPTVAYRSGYGVLDPVRDHLKELLDKVVPTDESVSYFHHMTTGDPAESICRLATEEDIDLIVLGTHGRTGAMRLLMGSVAEAVVRRATCPVLTYKQPSYAAAETN